MANHYREAIAKMLQDYDNHSHGYDFYMDLAWEGLRYPDIYIWNSKSGAEKERIDAVIDNYIVDNK
ncbi:MAG TPA: hypothetical protein VK112_12145 [Fodinibius sp.]|nr:hypothetical protein [Fodinibius sp.]